jgi:hypothetical protein
MEADVGLVQEGFFSDCWVSPVRILAYRTLLGKCLGAPVDDETLTRAQAVIDIAAGRTEAVAATRLNVIDTS